MTNLYIIDTHPLLWYLDGNAHLGYQARSILANPSSRFWLPVIALAEAFFILEKRRNQFSTTQSELTETIKADPRIRIVALGQRVLEQTLDCKIIDEMHDRQIVATAMLAPKAGFEIAIITRDGNITDSGLVPVIW
ncbi:MAG: PIN domain-containing protein [Caldilineaceae bacterium]|nr:PIN domain-containing protein [Caldilineaceae bacterium]